MNSNQVAKYRLKLRVWQFGLLAAIFFVWWALTKPGLIPAFVFDNDNQAAFFFGEPLVIFSRIWDWFVVNADIYAHLWTTLVETILAFAFGTVSGGLVGMWLALSPFAAAVADPFIKGLNSMPRVILAPIFAVWFGLGIASKVALGVTLVFFIVFFNVYQGVREVNPNVLASARMLGANRQQLLKNVYLPSAMSWVFSSLHTSVGMAFVGAVVGEYLGSSHGVGYLILQAKVSLTSTPSWRGFLCSQRLPWCLTGSWALSNVAPCVGSLEQGLLQRSREAVCRRNGLIGEETGVDCGRRFLFLATSLPYKTKTP